MAGRLLLALLLADACKASVNASPDDLSANVGQDPAPQTSGLYPAVVGIESCDQYAQEYPACINGYAPADQRDRLLSAGQQQVDGWKRTAGGPGKAGLQQTCARAVEAAANKFGPLGCTFTGFEQLATATSVETNPTPPPDNTQPTPPPEDPPPTARQKYPRVVGIHICDEYLWNYRKCIDEKGPRNNRRTLKRSLERKGETWKTSAEGGNKEGVEAECNAALEASRKKSKSWGCNF